MNLLNLIAKYILERTEETVAHSISRAIAPVGPYLKQVSLGLGCLLLSIPCFILSLLFLSGALFLQLLHGADWSIPALWTCLVTTLLGATLAGIGVKTIKKKDNALS